MSQKPVRRRFVLRSARLGSARSRHPGLRMHELEQATSRPEHSQSPLTHLARQRATEAEVDLADAAHSKREASACKRQPGQQPMRHLGVADRDCCELDLGQGHEGGRIWRCLLIGFSASRRVASSVLSVMAASASWAPSGDGDDPFEHCYRARSPFLSVVYAIEQFSAEQHSCQVSLWTCTSDSLSDLGRGDGPAVN